MSYSYLIHTNIVITILKKNFLGLRLLDMVVGKNFGLCLHDIIIFKLKLTKKWINRLKRKNGKNKITMLTYDF